jgi:hypothetical protein
MVLCTCPSVRFLDFGDECLGSSLLLRLGVYMPKRFSIPASFGFLGWSAVRRVLGGLID